MSDVSLKKYMRQSIFIWLVPDGKSGTISKCYICKKDTIFMYEVNRMLKWEWDWLLLHPVF